MVIRSQKRIVIVSIDGTVHAERKIGGGKTFYPLRAGRVLFCLGTGKHQVVVLGVGDKSLSLLAQFDTDLVQLCRSDSDEMFGRDALGQWYELTGLPPS